MNGGSVGQAGVPTTGSLDILNGGFVRALNVNVAPRGDATGTITVDGIGSTLITCEKTSRQAWLIESDPKYCDVSIVAPQRFASATRCSQTWVAGRGCGPVPNPRVWSLL